MSRLRKPPKRAKSFNFYLFFFFSSPSFSPFKSYFCSTGGGPTASRRSRSALPPHERTPGAVGRGSVFLCEAALFASTITQTCNELYKKTLASPEVWQQPFFLCAGRGREALPSPPPPPSYVSFGLSIFSTGSFRSLFTSRFLRCFFSPGFASCFLRDGK